MTSIKIYTATPADLSPPVQSESFCVDLVLASDCRELEQKSEQLQESSYRAGLAIGWNLGLANNNNAFNKCLTAHSTAGIQVVEGEGQ
ncbi:hypothetical protein RKT29_004204 [Salmonella enterica subsp. enterica serovar Lome]|nr:hypothetical protein [Salmonella enterica]ELD7744671.1 hypothetical protein [Salmonella enterica subsp. enterica serovar Lome]EHF3438925.1 hypothetical protein [Salmonella enterica]EHH4974262.1 hypothetical protein [Salmonella enterica]EHL7732290.1 hypothetical protein [Salmonella enterica]